MEKLGIFTMRASAFKQEGNKAYHLGFLEVMQEKQSFWGLIDSGANINCIGGKIHKHLKYAQLYKGSNRVHRVGGESKIHGKVEIKFTLLTGDCIKQSFLIVNELQ